MTSTYENSHDYWLLIVIIILLLRLLQIHQSSLNHWLLKAVVVWLSTKILFIKIIMTTDYVWSISLELLSILFTGLLFPLLVVIFFPEFGYCCRTLIYQVLNCHCSFFTLSKHKKLFCSKIEKQKQLKNKLET